MKAQSYTPARVLPDMYTSRYLLSLCRGLLYRSNVARQASGFHGSTGHAENGIHHLRRQLHSQKNSHSPRPLTFETESNLVLLLAASHRPEERLEALQRGEALWNEITSTTSATEDQKRALFTEASRTVMRMRLCSALRRCALLDKDRALGELWTRRFEQRVSNFSAGDLMECSDDEDACNENDEGGEGAGVVDIRRKDCADSRRPQGSQRDCSTSADESRSWITTLTASLRRARALDRGIECTHDQRTSSETSVDGRVNANTVDDGGNIDEDKECRDTCSVSGQGCEGDKTPHRRASSSSPSCPPQENKKQTHKTPRVRSPMQTMRRDVMLDHPVLQRAFRKRPEPGPWYTG